MKSLDLGTRIVANTGKRSAELPGEVIFLDEKSASYWGLSEVGLRVWTLVQQPRTILQIVDTLETEYDIGRRQCERDVLELISDMAEKGLVVVDDETVDQVP